MRMRMRVKIVFALLALSTLQCVAQVDRNTVEQVHAWLPVTCNVRFHEKWMMISDMQIRRADVIREEQQYLLRAGIERKITNDLSVAPGYAFVMTYPYGEQPVKSHFREHRAWQQVTTSHRIGRAAMQHRYRLEQRWLQRQQEDKRDEYMYLNRLRYRLQVNIPVNKPSIEKGCVFASLSNEAFIGFGRNVGMNILDQNRAMAAVGIQLTKSMQAQGGYLNQTILKSNGIDVEANHTIIAGITFNIDLIEKQ